MSPSALRSHVIGSKLLSTMGSGSVELSLSVGPVPLGAGYRWEKSQLARSTEYVVELHQDQYLTSHCKLDQSTYKCMTASPEIWPRRLKLGPIVTIPGTLNGLPKLAAPPHVSVYPKKPTPTYRIAQLDLYGKRVLRRRWTPSPLWCDPCCGTKREIHQMISDYQVFPIKL